MTIPLLLSVVIPAYNEESFIDGLIDQVVAVDLSRLGMTKQLIVVDDGSRDRTVEIVQARSDVELLIQEKNQGKGAAIRRGIDHAIGDYIIIQDADLEYDPQDYISMLEKILTTGDDPVYGSRYLGDPKRGGVYNFWAAKRSGQSWKAYLGGRSLSLAAQMLTGKYLTDTVTALKLFRGPVLQGLSLETTGFETDHEITSKILHQGHDIHEVSIRYFPRSIEDGKKIGLSDWLKAWRTFGRYRNG